MATNPPHTNRRTLLRTVAGSGALALAAGVGTAGEDGDTMGSKDEYTTITTGVHRGEPTSTAEVPTAWYERVKAARRAMGALAEEHLDSRWVVSVGRTSSEERIGGFRIPELELHVADAGGAPDDDSLEVEGVSVTVVEGGHPQPHACEDEPEPCDTDPFGPFDRLPGGAAVSAEKTDNIRGRQSGGIAVETPEGESRYLTAAHGFAADDCDDEIEGRGLEHGGRTVGEVREHDWKGDWAAVELTEDADVEGFAHEVVPRSAPVVGHVTEDGIDYLRDYDQTVYRYGRGTCEEEGTIESDNLYLFCSNTDESDEERRFVRTSMVSEKGDSGGPHYRLLDGRYPRIEIIGVHNGCSRGAWASAAYDIHDRAEFEFGTGEILAVDM